MHFQLFSDLKIFCNFVRKFKFDNCYAYDKAQRTQLAAQISAPHNNHTTSWSQQNDELSNLYLRDIYLPACYYCNNYGHFAHICPFKSPSSTNNLQQLNNFRPFRSQYSYISSAAATPSRPPTNYNRPSRPISPQAFLSNATNNNAHSTIKSVCHRFNQTGFCRKPPCNFLHICNVCRKQGHPGFRCFSKTDTAFMPPTK